MSMENDYVIRMYRDYVRMLLNKDTPTVELSVWLFSAL